MTGSGEKGLEFVTIEGLLAYGEAMSGCPRVEGAHPPPGPAPSNHRVQQVQAAMEQIRQFVNRAQAGFPDAEAYRTAREALLKEASCRDDLVLYAAWNRVLADGGLTPLLRAPIGHVQKPTQRRPVAIVPRAPLTPHP